MGYLKTSIKIPGWTWVHTPFILTKYPSLLSDPQCYTPFTPRSQVGPEILNMGQSQVRPGFRPASVSRTTWVMAFYTDA